MPGRGALLDREVGTRHNDRGNGDDGMNKNMCVLPLVAVAILLGGCSSLHGGRDTDRPTADQMRVALRELFAAQPKVLIPEFEASLKSGRIVEEGGVIRMGLFECDPRQRSFVAFFSSASLPMYKVEGRFELGAGDVWHAFLSSHQGVTARDPNRRVDWDPSDSFSWSKQRD